MVCRRGFTLVTTLVALSMLLAVGSVNAQSITGGQSSASMRVRAAVMATLGIVGTNNLSFGQIPATSSGGSRRVEKSSPDAGRFEVTGSGDQQIQIRFVSPSELNRAEGFGRLGVQLELFGASSAANASSARRVTQSETVSLSNGRYFFFIGGNLNVGPLSQNPPGEYSGEFELEVSYSNL